MRTQLAIAGPGPGTLLSQILHRAGIDSVVAERQSRDHVFQLIRAGVLVWGSIDVRRRIWGSVRSSWWLTMLLHRFRDQSDLEQNAREAELDYLADSSHPQASFCEQCAGLPLDDALLVSA